MDLTRRQMYAIAIIAMAVAMIAVGLGFGVRVAIKKTSAKPSGKPTAKPLAGLVKPTAKPTGMYAVGPASNGMVAIRDPRLDKLYASKLPAIKPASVPSLGPKPKPASVPSLGPKPKPTPAPPSCLAAARRVCKDKSGACGKRIAAAIARCTAAPEPAPAVYVPTAPASPAPGIVKLLLDPVNRRGKVTTPRDPRLNALPTPVQTELARLAVRGTATEIRNATVDLGGSTVGVLGGEFAGAPVGPDDVSAINQYLDQLSRQPASLLAGN